jgi:hypothetical protein
MTRPIRRLSREMRRVSTLAFGNEYVPSMKSLKELKLQIQSGFSKGVSRFNQMTVRGTFKGRSRSTVDPIESDITDDEDEALSEYEDTNEYVELGKKKKTCGGKMCTILETSVMEESFERLKRGVQALGRYVPATVAKYYVDRKGVPDLGFEEHDMTMYDNSIDIDHIGVIDGRDG